MNFSNVLLFLIDVYSLCVAYPEPLADKLYSETKKFLEEHVDSLLIKVYWLVVIVLHIYLKMMITAHRITYLFAYSRFVVEASIIYYLHTMTLGSNFQEVLTTFICCIPISIINTSGENYKNNIHRSLIYSFMLRIAMMYYSRNMS